MAKSLQDQFAGLGLVDAKKARQLDRERRQQKRKDKHTGSQSAVDPAIAQDPDASVAAALAERERVAARGAAREQAAQHDRVRQIVESNRIDRQRSDSDVAYHFIDGQRVSTVYVAAPVRDRLARGSIQIVTLGGSHELVSRETAERLAGIDPELIIGREERPGRAAEADYADFPIPDDLDW